MNGSGMMNGSKKWLVMVMAVAAAGLSLAALSQGTDVKGAKKEQLDKKQPIQITSDVLEYMNNQRLVVFSGNAIAVQGDVIIRSDKLLLYYKKSADEGKPKEAKDVEQTGDLERIEAKGRVNVTKGNRVATGDEAVYDQYTQKIIMTGNATMREGKNVVRGHKITLMINEDRGIVEAQERKRVTAIIYPKEKNESKEPGK
jgi:lipopolysaccharide export system protein LptA